MSKTIHGTKSIATLRQSDRWFKRDWHKRFRANARALSRRAELCEDITANDYPRMREVSDLVDCKSEHW
jgi:hypothetical protein